MSKLINPSQSGNGVQFGSTIVRGCLNVSGRAVGYGQILVPDWARIDSRTTTTAVTFTVPPPGSAGSCFANWRDIPAETGTNIRRFGRSMVGIVMTEVTGGTPDGGVVDLMLEGFTQAWLAHIADAAPAIYTQPGCLFAPSYPATNVSRILWGNILSITAAGLPSGISRPCATLVNAGSTATTPFAMTSATAAENVAETNTFPLVRPGGVGTRADIHNVANGMQLCEILFDGVRGF